MTTARDFSELIEILSLEKKAYRLLLSLSEGQREVFERDGAPGLMRVIARKQEAIAGLRTLEARLSQYTRDWQSTLKALPQEARTEVDDLLAEISSVVERVISGERAIEAFVRAARDEVAKRARAVSEGRTLVKAYGGLAATATAGRYLDREG